MKTRWAGAENRLLRARYPGDKASNSLSRRAVHPPVWHREYLHLFAHFKAAARLKPDTVQLVGFQGKRPLPLIQARQMIGASDYRSRHRSPSPGVVQRQANRCGMPLGAQSTWFQDDIWSGSKPRKGTLTVVCTPANSGGVSSNAIRDSWCTLMSALAASGCQAKEKQHNYSTTDSHGQAPQIKSRDAPEPKRCANKAADNGPNDS